MLDSSRGITRRKGLDAEIGPYTLGTDVPIGCRLRETEGRLRQPLIHPVGGHLARRPLSLSMGEKTGPPWFLGPLDLLPWRVVGWLVSPSVRPAKPVTQQ